MHTIFILIGLFSWSTYTYSVQVSETPNPAATSAKVQQIHNANTTVNKRPNEQGSSFEQTNTIAQKNVNDDQQAVKKPEENDTDLNASSAVPLKKEDTSLFEISHDHHQANVATFEEMSALSMYQQADWVVKSVMLILVFASILSWTILCVKSLHVFQAGQRISQLNFTLANGSDLNTILQTKSTRSGANTGVEYDLLNEVQKECDWLSTQSHLTSMDGVKERAAQRLHAATDDATAKLSQGVSLLASISSTAPFIGLFGTVWGIMNSFIGIANTQTTNLAVVAPGIAEALLATAAGLVAAIPAALFYNLFVRKLADYRRSMEGISSNLMIMLSQHLDTQTMKRSSHHSQYRFAEPRPAPTQFSAIK